MDKILPGMAMLAVAAAVIIMIYRGWRSRQQRQDALEPLPAVPELGEPDLAVVGQYVTTTTAGDWLDRVAVHGLGIRSRAGLAVHAGGVLITRPGCEELFIPAASLQEVARTSGMAGKFLGQDRIVVATWRLGEQSLDTGFMPGDAADTEPLQHALKRLLGQAGA
ncbi:MULTISPECIES: hypothetical protein [Arthrobacter]|uniref:PH domain-containing protein n=2 Tax=Arthrobacter TaxID=1663 RepID=A0ABU9KGM0_9MICC|nr:hypothetical protein [Arthrobacter sp. YJM1]MDP5226046.1 hypothetical protein [Arthrobacter sp. YJM1]